MSRAVRAPRGFYVICGSILCGAAAVIALDVARPGGAHGVPLAQGPRPVATVTRPAPPVTVTVTPPTRLVPVIVPVPAWPAARSGSGAASSVPSPSPSVPRPSRSPTPSPAPGPGLGLSVGVAAPLRGATPVAVTAAVLAPGAPPDPPLGVGFALR